MFNDDHVMPQAFGTFLSNLVLKVVCEDCNQFFGDTIELHLGRATPEGLQRYISGIKPAAEVNNFKYGAVSVRLADDAVPPIQMQLIDEEGELGVRAVANQVSFRLADGSERYFREDELARGDWKSIRLADPIQFQIISNEGDNAVERMAAMLRAHGIDTADTVPVRLDLPEDRAINVRLVAHVTEEAQRAIAKIAFNYLANRLGHDIAMRAGFDTIRHFILEGWRPAHPLIVSTDIPFIRSRVDPTLRFKNHAVMFRAHPADGRLLGQVTLHGVLSYIILLAPNAADVGAGNVLMGHIFDPATRTLRQIDQELADARSQTTDIG